MSAVLSIKACGPVNLATGETTLQSVARELLSDCDMISLKMTAPDAAETFVFTAKRLRPRNPKDDIIETAILYSIFKRGSRA